MTELIGMFASKIPTRRSSFKLPDDHSFAAMPEPIKTILWRLSQMHNANIENLHAIWTAYFTTRSRSMSARRLFCRRHAPFRTGLPDWAEDMIQNFAANHEW